MTEEANRRCSVFMDIDLRPQLVVVPTEESQPSSTTANTANNLDSNCSTFSVVTNTMTSFVRSIEDISSSNARNVVAISSPKVSFKIQKSFNKLEKSTENLLSAPPAGSKNTATAAAATSNVPSANDAKPKVQSMDTKDLLLKKDAESSISSIVDNSLAALDSHVSKDHEALEDVKKRPLAPPKDEEEPLAKKSKSTKLDK